MGRRVYRAEKPEEKKNPTTTSDYINVILCVCVCVSSSLPLPHRLTPTPCFVGHKANIVLPSYVIQVLDFLRRPHGPETATPPAEHWVFINKNAAAELIIRAENKLTCFSTEKLNDETRQKLRLPSTP
jgi:hypothetical protein